MKNDGCVSGSMESVWVMMEGEELWHRLSRMMGMARDVVDGLPSIGEVDRKKWYVVEYGRCEDGGCGIKWACMRGWLEFETEKEAFDRCEVVEGFRSREEYMEYVERRNKGVDIYGNVKDGTYWERCKRRVVVDGKNWGMAVLVEERMKEANKRKRGEG